MADAATSVPVRTQNNGDVKVNIADGTTESQLLAVDASGRVTVKLDDGSGNAITSQVNGTQRALDVGIDVAGVQIDPRSIRALTSADTVTTVQGTTPWADNITQIGGSAIALGQTTSSASIPVTIASNQTAVSVTNTADGSATGGTAGTQSLLSGGIYNSTAPTLTTGQQASLQLDASGNLDVNLKTSIPAGSALIGGTNVYVGGAIATVSNPVPVTVTTSTPGTPVQNYQTSASLAVGSSVTLTYAVAASHTLTLYQVYASASGKIKAVVAAAGSTIFVGFNSVANPNINVQFQVPPVIAAAGTVTVTITNEDILPFDVYTLIEGNQN